MIIHADCVEAMQAMEPDSVDAVIADPPYGIGFMGKEWDGAGDGRSWATMGGPSGSDNTKHTERGGAMHAGKYDLSVTANRRFQDWCQLWATEALRVLKPGGHLLAFGGTRTYHRLACAVEDAGFEIRDSLIWIYGSGFPKSLDVSKAIDKAAVCPKCGGDGCAYYKDGVLRCPACGGSGKATREVLRERSYEMTDGGGYSGDLNTNKPRSESSEVSAPATPEAQHWQGWGTALKPSHEPIVVARKPLVGTVAANVLKHGTGALNIDGCRIEHESDTDLATSQAKNPGRDDLVSSDVYGNGRPQQSVNTAGRWPPNLTLSHLPECKQTGTRKVKSAGGRIVPQRDHHGYAGLGDGVGRSGEVAESYRDEDGETIPAYTCAEGCPVAELDRQSGEVGSSRFFYVAKASRAERNAGLEGFEERDAAQKYGLTAGGNTPQQTPHLHRAAANSHPTVKPIALMRWLVRLVTPKGGTVLDPFTGSGSTGVAAVLEGFDFVGIEREAEYVALAEARVRFWAQFPGADVDKVLLSDARAREIEASGQLGLL